MACRTSDCQHNAMVEPSNVTDGSGDDPARDAVGHESVVRSPGPPDNPAAERRQKRRPSADVQPDPSIIPSSAPPPLSPPPPSSTGQSMEGMMSRGMSRQSTPRPVLQPKLATSQFIYARGHVIRSGRSTEPFSSASPEASSDASQWYRDTNQDPGRDTRFIIANGTFSVNPARLLDVYLPFVLQLSLTTSVPDLLDDPPFYFTQPDPISKHGMTVSARASNANVQWLSSDNCRHPMQALETSQNTCAELRGVVDDLTIQNRKLKRRLAKYRKSHSVHLKKEKLFEVRIHGMPPDRKRELEETLQSFAINLGGSPTPIAHPLASHFPSMGTRGTTSADRPSTYTASDSTTYSKPVDSAYASLSTCGGKSSAVDACVGARSDRSREPQRTHTVDKSYVNDLLAGLYPARGLVMTDVEKKKLVVRRLEQLFAGNIRDGGVDHAQPAQQQEVSNSAARADRVATEANGQVAQVEGDREAQIFPIDGVAGTDHYMTGGMADVGPGAAEAPRSQETFGGDARCGSGPSTGEQRPTRPLDLDPHRAQHAAENIGYIRHLGLPNPIASALHADGVQTDGWVYLNLLVSMAQLHTINVTPEFVRRALRDESTMFQLSPDARKVRWSGEEGPSSPGLVTPPETSSDGKPCVRRRQVVDPETAPEERLKRPRLQYSSVSYRSTTVETPGPRPSEAPITGPACTRSYPGSTEAVPWPLAHPLDSDQKYQYKPLLVHAVRSEGDEDDSCLREQQSSSSDEAGFYNLKNGLSQGGLESADQLDLGSRLIRRTPGPIIFYSNNPHFCTDLSGDAMESAMPHRNPIVYAAFTPHIMGLRADGPFLDDPRQRLVRRTGGETPTMERFQTPTTNMAATTMTPVYGAASLWVDEGETIIAGLDPFDVERIEEEGEMLAPRLVNFRVFGLGGVYPSDNLAVRVRVRYPLSTKPYPAPRRPTPAPPPMLVSRMMQELSMRVPTRSQSAVRRGTRMLEQAWPAPTAKPAFSVLPHRSEILSSVLIHLPPSELPAPSYVQISLSSSETSDPSMETLGSAIDSSSTSEESYLSGRADEPRRPKVSGLEWHKSRVLAHDDGSAAELRERLGEQVSEESSDEDSPYGSDSGSSIDLLAAARALDPETIAAREREFESQAGPQFSVELPAGSSAATVGAGSGFSSDAVEGMRRPSGSDAADSDNPPDSMELDYPKRWM